MNISEKCFNELVELVEEIINEVSVGALARATENNAEKRKENSDKALKTYYKAQDEYEKAAKKHPEEEPALYRRLQDVDKAACKEFDKNTHAQALKDLNLPKDSKVSANKLFKAANKVEPKRDKEYDEVTGQSDSRKFWKGMRRWNRANDIVYADPVKSRNESLEEALAVLEGLFVNDGRGDLFDDISKAMTGKTVMGNVKAGISKLVKPKKKVKTCKENFDNSQKISYNIKEAIKIMEAVINEVSPNFTVPRLISKEDEVKEIAKKEEETTDPIEKKKLADKRVKLEHKLNVTKDHVFNYHANQLKKEKVKKKD